MKNRKSIPVFMIAAALVSLTFMTSCKKDSSTSANEEDMITNADQFQEAEGATSDVDNISDIATQTNSANFRLTSNDDHYGILGCATVNRDTVNQVVTIDFGTGCTGNDGRTRSGQIIIHYSGGTYFTPGFQRIVTFNNYFVNNRHIEGTRTITNNGNNAAGHLNWTVDAQNMRVTRPNGTYHTWNSLRTREMIAGDTLLFHPADDVYSITGSSNGSNSNGNTCSAVITTALIKRGNCHWIVSGTVDITPSNRPVRTLDFGSGNCDDLATVTKNGISHLIHLH
ncbi:MAG: hypothetical protein NT126_11720 [Bacteroidetes bacterium]|nr:hypothetical protein [Bacteroidota bacterium]